MRTFHFKSWIQTIRDWQHCRSQFKNSSQDHLNSCLWWSKTCQAMLSPNCVSVRFQCCLLMSQSKFWTSLKNLSSLHYRWNCLNSYHGKRMQKNWSSQVTPQSCPMSCSLAKWKKKDSVPRITVSLQLLSQYSRTQNLSQRKVQEKKFKLLTVKSSKRDVWTSKSKWNWRRMLLENSWQELKSNPSIWTGFSLTTMQRWCLTFLPNLAIQKFSSKLRSESL